VPVLAAGALFTSVAASVQTASPAKAQSAPPPPPIKVLSGSASRADGDIFLAPFGEPYTYSDGPEILSPAGRVIWYHRIPLGQQATDFRTQTYHGQPVLTWWQGTAFGGLSSGADYIYNDHFKQIATVRAGNGYRADGHEFLITPSNTALITVYAEATADLASIGGPADQAVIDGIVQEINIKTGRVLFQWNSAGHVPYSDSHEPLPSSASTPWDWFHLNAVHLASDGSLLIDARSTWAVYDVSLRTGRINWELGGKQSSFKMAAAHGQKLDSAKEIFAWQHDPEQVGTDLFTFFDNESAGTPLLPYSRAVTVRLDFRTKVATLIASDNQPEGYSVESQGNAQTTGNGDLFVNWGITGSFSEFSPSGKLLFNARFAGPAVYSYRAYQLPWPSPARVARPATAYVVNSGSDTVTPINTATGKAGKPITVGKAPDAIAITPSSKTAYVVNSGSDTVTPINTATGKIGEPIVVGKTPTHIAITANGKTAYVVNSGSDTVTPIYTATNRAGKAIQVGSDPDAIAITPNGTTVYVANRGSRSVTPISTTGNKAGKAIQVGSDPDAIAITPNSRTVYVANRGSDSVTPISTTGNKAGRAITVGTFPVAIAITPNGTTAYVVNDAAPGSVTPIRTATNKAGKATTVGSFPVAIAITPGGTTAYVPSTGSGTVTPISTATSKAGKTIKTIAGSMAYAIAITPDGKTVYVTVLVDSGIVIPIPTATNKAGKAISVGSFPAAIAITP
jgi:YVTN family beta-propeller protein